MGEKHMSDVDGRDIMVHNQLVVDVRGFMDGHMDVKNGRKISPIGSLTLVGNKLIFEDAWYPFLYEKSIKFKYSSHFDAFSMTYIL